MARAKPILRALGCSFSGSFPETIDKKTILSIPKMISKNVSVSSATQAFGLEINSVMIAI